MTWVLIIAVAWLAVSVVAALLIAGMISLADLRRRVTGPSSPGNFTIDVHTVGGAPDGPRAVAGQDGPHDDSRQAVEEPRRTVPPTRTPVVRDCIPPTERVTRTRQTGTR